MALESFMNRNDRNAHNFLSDDLMETDEVTFDAVSRIIKVGSLHDLLFEDTTFSFAKSGHPDLID
jgi:hypothetical protein